MTEGRVLVLANAKVLYGGDIEVCAIPDGQYIQAVLMKYDPSTSCWNKLLHTSKDKQYNLFGALDELYKLTQAELAKRFTASGATVPFSGDPTQVVALRRNGSDAPPDDSGFEIVSNPRANSSRGGIEAAFREPGRPAPSLEKEPAPKVV